MFSKKTFVVVSVVAAALVAACGGNGAGSGGAGAGTGAGHSGSGAGSSQSGYTCCINDAHYRCPDKAAFDKCSGFDIDACMQACSPSDFGCSDKCFQQWSSATNDPSGCTEDATVMCGGGPTGGSCVGDWDGKMCDIDADCASNNCYQNKCYGTANGNPCDIDADCESDNCHLNCCYGNGSGSPCDIDADCESDNCYNNVCQ